MKIKFENSEERTATFSNVNGNKITYTYTIVSGDNGELSMTSYKGNVYDVAGNITSIDQTNLQLSNDSQAIIADTIQPTLEITASESNPTRADKITYTFTFSENVTGFTADDISVTNGEKGTFAGSGAVYTLLVTNTGSCEQTISVAEGACTDEVKDSTGVINGNLNTTKKELNQ